MRLHGSETRTWPHNKTRPYACARKAACELNLEIDMAVEERRIRLKARVDHANQNA